MVRANISSGRKEVTVLIGLRTKTMVGAFHFMDNKTCVVEYR